MEFRKIKKVLTEETAEVSSDNNKNNLMDTYGAREEVKNGSDLYREAVLTAIKSENDAIEEYDGILKMEEQTEDKELVNLFHDDLVHIRDEEKAHFQMLAEKLSQIPGFDTEEELEKEKESVKESVELKEEVNSNRTYDIWDIDRAVQKYVDLTDETYDMISDLFYKADDEVSAEEAQEIVNEIKSILHLSDNVIVLIETELNNTVSPAEKRIEEFEEDIDNDIYYIKELIDEGKIHTQAAFERLVRLQTELENLKSKYHGEKDTGWRREHHITGDKPTKQIIS